VTVNSSDYGRLFFQAEVFHAGRLSERRARPTGAITEPARRVPVFRDCDVLVAGGGPAGTAAAIAAVRAGADVVLIERHNHLGGLWTGGLVIWIDRMTDWSGRRVIEGVAAELLDRLRRDAVADPSRSDWGSADAATAAYWKERTAAFHGIVTWSPTIDREHLKLLSQEILLGAGVHLVFHAWVAAPIVEEGRVAGAVFESKEGRLAIRAGVTIDRTGDGDLFHRAGAGSESDIDDRDIHHCTNTAWLLVGSTCPAGSLAKPEIRKASRLSWSAAGGPAAVSSSGPSYRGATMLRCSWDRGLPAIRRSMSRTRPRSRSARTG
jgi:hypothetical protein